MVNRRKQQLCSHYWYPPSGLEVRCLVFLSHGFSEHLGLYQELGEYLSTGGCLVFGHDHVGHGASEGKRVYIENVEHYVDDIIEHCMFQKEKHSSLPLFILGHSMGGMISLRCVIRYPHVFQGMLLNGPLIIPGPQIGPLDLRATPVRTFVSKSVLQLLSYVIPETCLGGPNMSLITRDKDAQDSLAKDQLRWTGGCKVMLLLAFVLCMDDNINQLTQVSTPLLLLHGENDQLCNPLGSQLLYRRSQSEDKTIKIFPGACHQLFLEFPAVRKEAFQDIFQWVSQRW